MSHMGTSATQPPEQRLAALAATQHGVVSRPQLRALGFGETPIARRVAAGRLIRLHPGVYAVGHARLRREGWWLAAVLACGDGAVLSHRDAAELWGLLTHGAGCIHVTVPRSSGRRSTARVAIHRAVRPVEATVRSAVPVTTVARTLADLAEILPERALEKACEQAAALRRLDVRSVDALAAAQPGRHGPVRVRALLRMHDVTTTTRSALEDEFLAFCALRGIPRPVVNGRIGGHEVDFHWPAARLIVETDGYRYHAGPAAFVADRARDRELAALGWLVIRVTAADLGSRPAVLAGQLLRLISVRSPSPVTPGSPSP
jgi:very-short-patch-repair endonuclease